MHSAVRLGRCALICLTLATTPSPSSNSSTKAARGFARECDALFLRVRRQRADQAKPGTRRGKSCRRAKAQGDPAEIRPSELRATPRIARLTGAEGLIRICECFGGWNPAALI